MTTVLVTLAIVAVLLVVGFGYVAWRDRMRLTSGEDAAAARDARARQQRYEAERHGSQGDLRRRGEDGSSF